MNIIVTGTRGIPNIQGGIETHCEELYPFISRNGVDVTIICRSPFVNMENNANEYKRIKLKTIFSPKSKAFEAIIHTILAVIYAVIKRPDILHIHAVGPNLVTPLARILGLKVVMTHHGPDYKRQKWNRAAKLFLRLGEFFGVKFANKVIVISRGIGESIDRKYTRKDYSLIPNGVPKAVISEGTNYLVSLGLTPKKYIFTLGRFVPEKGFDYLIDAFLTGKFSEEYKLVIAGDADHETEYSRKLKNKAEARGIILTGFIKGESLQQLFTHARLFILPSYYEGLPIALLEAMSYGLNIIASDIDANKEVNLTHEDYFKCGDILSLTSLIELKLQDKHINKNYDLTNYLWENIAEQTINVYRSLVQAD